VAAVTIIASIVVIGTPILFYVSIRFFW